MRIDRLLCNLRFVRTRSLASKLASTGQLRRNGVRITRASQEVVVGDVLTIPLGAAIRLVEVLALPEQRGRAREAQACYRALDRIAQTDLGDHETPSA
ncbi:MAG: RNA-binding S4 domain-containing protein [Altererythrobacter sp.]|nr:RNA-binding S4 domain-containing protein [Altererythrobacter sp.]